MALETGTHISDLNAANPVSTDGLAQADDHLRLIKSTILASFPNITGAMTATHTILNGLDGRVSAIENGVHASGTKMLFQQSTAPTGWTKQTTHNDKALRVVTGTASTGGSNTFSAAFGNITPSGTVSTSSQAQSPTMLCVEHQPAPAHTHTYFRQWAGGFKRLRFAQVSELTGSIVRHEPAAEVRATTTVSQVQPHPHSPAQLSTLMSSTST